MYLLIKIEMSWRSGSVKLYATVASSIPARANENYFHFLALVGRQNVTLTSALVTQYFKYWAACGLWSVLTLPTLLNAGYSVKL